MDKNKNGLEGEASHTQPQGSDLLSVRPKPTKGKLLAVVYPNYLKLYAENYTQLQVVNVADCSHVSSELILKAESLALELAESQVPLSHQHLWDERLLVDSICTRVPTVDELAYFEGLWYGLSVVTEAVKRSRAKRRAL